MKFILGTKQEMTQTFDESGKVHPATILSAGPVVVTQVKTVDTDGYSAVQVGYGTRRESRISKPVRGHLKGLGNFRFLKEFRSASGTLGDMKVGDKITADIFAKGDIVKVSGTSKGKGFQGGVKRHGFAGGSRTHGQKHSEREPGSLGGGGRAGGEVRKGMRMAGRMGGERITVQGLRVLEVHPETGTILLSGAVPGPRGTVIEVETQD